MPMCIRSVGICVLALCCAQACSTGGNTRLTLSDHVALGAIDPGAARSITELPESPLEVDTYRREWPTIWFYVPVDGTDHWYLGRTDTTYTNATARQRRVFPTALSAIELGGDTVQMQAFEAIVAPLQAAWDALLLGPRLFGWAVFGDLGAVSPDIDYERYPDTSPTRTQRRIWLGEDGDEAEPGGDG